MDESQSANFQPNVLQNTNEPRIGFSPDRNRFDGSTTLRTLSAGSIDISDLLLDASGSSELSPAVISSSEAKPHHTTNSDGFEKVVVAGSGTQLQKRLERHIAQANKTLPTKVKVDESPPWSMSSRVINTSDSNHSNGNLKVHIPASPNHTMGSSGTDSRSRALLPPQRLAIPRRSGNNNPSLNLNTQEAKPLVQWDTDDSEDELSFFPGKGKNRLTDNLSVDNLSLSGEEEDLHLAPPRLTSPGHCPCDPRPLLRTALNRFRRAEFCAIA